MHDIRSSYQSDKICAAERLGAKGHDRDSCLFEARGGACARI
jgi:hypothetical protein